MRLHYLINIFIFFLLIQPSFSCAFEEELFYEFQRKLHESSNTRNATLDFSPVELVPDELMLVIFSSLHQRDIPSVTLSCKRWARLMDDNLLWKTYAQRALFIMKEEEYCPETDYKALFKSYCIPSFIDVGTLKEGSSSVAQAISFDGSVVVGQTWLVPFIWTQEAGMQALEDGIEGSAYGVSADGSTIVGQAFDESPHNGRRYSQAFRWTRDKGIEFLGSLEGKTSTIVRGTNFDGSVIIGTAFDDATSIIGEAFKWTEGIGFESLSPLSEGNGAMATGINYDGTIIVGQVGVNERAGQIRDAAVRWSPTQGIYLLGTLNAKALEDASAESQAFGISHNGLTVVGAAADGDEHYDPRAFKWTAEKGMESLGTIKGKNCSWAQAVNYDGSVIAGYVDNINIYHFNSTNCKRAFRWTSEKGMELIENLLVKPTVGYPYPKDTPLNRLKVMLWGMNQESLLPPGWILNEVHAVTPSGVVLVGEGEYEGQVRAWRAIIPRGNLF